jgi:hypothetical protein
VFFYLHKITKILVYLHSKSVCIILAYKWEFSWKCRVFCSHLYNLIRQWNAKNSKTWIRRPVFWFQLRCVPLAIQLLFRASISSLQEKTDYQDKQTRRLGRKKSNYYGCIIESNKFVPMYLYILQGLVVHKGRKLGAEFMSVSHISLFIIKPSSRSMNRLHRQIRWQIR